MTQPPSTLQSRSRSGFTLLEILIVTAILGVVTAVIGACLSAGIRVWETSQTFLRVDMNLANGMGILEKDLANAIRFYDIPFVGEEQSVWFPGIVWGTAGREGDAPPRERIGTVHYFFEENERALFRKTWVYPDDEPRHDRSEKILSNVTDLKFRYVLLSDGNGEAAVLADRWTNVTNAPDGIRMDLSLSEAGQEDRISRLIVFPVRAERLQQ